MEGDDRNTTAVPRSRRRTTFGLAVVDDRITPSRLGPRPVRSLPGRVSADSPRSRRFHLHGADVAVAGSPRGSYSADTHDADRARVRSVSAGVAAGVRSGGARAAQAVLPARRCTAGDARRQGHAQVTARRPGQDEPPRIAVALTACSSADTPSGGSPCRERHFQLISTAGAAMRMNARENSGQLNSVGSSCLVASRS